jgi:hypothetical protein
MNGRNDDEDTDLESRVIKKIYAWLVVGGVAIGGVGGSGVLRIDKFTRTDFDNAMNEHLRLEAVQHEVLSSSILGIVGADRKKEEKDCQDYRRAIGERIIRLEIKQANILDTQQQAIRILQQRGLVPTQ